MTYHKNKTSDPFHIASFDIEDIPLDVINNMCEFNFIDISGKGRIIEVIDGDTVKLLAGIDIDLMSKGRYVKDGRQTKASKVIKYPLITTKDAPYIFIILKARMNGIDAAEHNTHQGQYVKDEMTRLFTSMNNIVYFILRKPDKYGRTLVDLYAEPEHITYLNHHLLNKDVPDLGICVELYSGGSKSDYMKSLPLID
jgi:hypothetical protein